MIYITQGHELGIGLEVFLKSFSLLNSSQQRRFSLVVFRDALEKNLQALKVSYSISEKTLSYNTNKITLIEPKDNNLPQSTCSLNTALENISNEDILLTLPTSKDQLIDCGELRKGYTEYLRYRFETEDLCMVFKAFDDATLLITDHIPLSEVGNSITSDKITTKVRTTINGFKKYFYNLDEIILSGINPHCGEGGLLGNEDKVLEASSKDLASIIDVIGPVSGDTLHFHKNNKKQLKVYMFHDQGLPQFKDKYKTVGLNITLGLPFLRMSVDHGTAFELYGKGEADFSGCFYMLKEAIKVDRKLKNEQQ